MSEKLVTLDLLKAFGDKSKKIFRPTTVLNPEGFKYLKVDTSVSSSNDWSFNTELWTKGCMIEGSYSGDLKATITSNNNALSGLGAIYYGTYLKGVSFIVDSEYVTLLFEFDEDSVAEALVDILNYKNNNGCNIVNTAEFIQSLIDYLDSITEYNTIGTVDGIVGTMGVINSLDIKPTSGMFQIRIPSKTSKEDTVGVLLRVPGSEYTINKVNSSKWSDYLSSKYNITFKQGDLNEFLALFGSDTNTEIVLEGPEINNHVDGYEGYAEGDLVGRVRVNSKGLVTAVEKESELPTASLDTLGGVKLGYTADLIEKNYPVQTDNDGNAYVHVSWNDTDTWNKVANDTDLGLVKVGYEENGKNYPVELDSESKAFVNVPWESNNYDLATKDNAGLIKTGYNNLNTTCLPVYLDDKGNAYAKRLSDVATGFVKTMSLGGLVNNVNRCYCLPPVNGGGKNPFGDDYLELEWTTPLITEFTIIVDAISIGQSYSNTKVIRFENPYQELVIQVKVNKGDGVRLYNMFNTAITNEGISLLPGQLIELTFAYWQNNVTLNGAISV